MISFTSEVFFALFEDYNLSIWPAQVIAYVLGVLALALVFRPSASSSRIIGAVLASLWLWNGVAYHWNYFATINFVAPVFAALFVAEALLLAWYLVIRGGVVFRFSKDMTGYAGVALALFAMVFYPLLGASLGKVWPQLVLFGVAPTPTVIFTLGLLLLIEPRVPRLLILIPLLWVIIAGSAVWFLGIHENISLIIAGLAALVLMIGKKHQAS